MIKTIKTLSFTVALLVPGLAYAGNPSADLTVQIVPGGLPGSILPPGNWTLAFNDEFNGTSLDTTFWTSATDGTGLFGGQVFVHNSTTVTVSGGELRLVSFDTPAAGTTGTCHPNGCVNGAVISHTFSSAEGYYEARLKSQPADYTAFWGANTSIPNCGAFSGGFETDIMESFGGSNAQVNTHWSGYGSCHLSSGTGSIFASADTFHVWGVWINATDGVTYYRDGVQIFHLDGPIATAAASPFNLYFHIEGGGGNPPFEIDWFRFYRAS